jgi:catechol 2,3-dioxygenase-like lactoylglutathione lyase family enzyme
MSLKSAKIATRLPAQDLERARAWYAEKLGLHASEERDGGLLYKIGDAEFALYASAGTPDGSFTQMAFSVSDVVAKVAELRARGVIFETYDTPDFKTRDGIAEIVGNYPSKGDGERACWFRDSEGNMLGMGQSIRRSEGASVSDS